MIATRPLLACSLCALLFACAKEEAPKATETVKTAAKPSTDEATELCLADPAGHAPIDEELRAQQVISRKLPMNLDPYLRLGMAWVKKARNAFDPGFYVNVDRCAEVALRIDPLSTLALDLRGLVYLNDHRFAKARDVANSVLERDGEDVIALGILSDAELELGEIDAAVKTAQRMVDVKPSVASYSRAAYLRWLQGDTKGAKVAMKTALEAAKDPRDPEPTAWTFTQAAAIYWNEADYEGADAVYAEALKWVPDYPPALAGRGRAAISMNQPRRAIEFLERSAKMSPLADTWWLLGDARMLAGDEAGANEAYAQAITAGRREDALALALFLATKNREPAEALRLVEDELKSRGGPYADDVHAWALYRSGKLEEAKRASGRALRFGTRDARLLYHAGAIRIALGETREGLKLVKDALALNPKFDYTGAAEAAKLVAANDKS